MSKLAVHFSSNTPEWPTPQAFYDELHDEFGFTLDPCSTHDNAKTERHYTPDEDGLAQSWAGETVFMNPPYGREISKWVAKAYEEANAGATVVCLLPARTDTAWWHDYCAKGEVRFVRGRLKFGGAKTSAPFPSAVVIFRPYISDVRTRIVLGLSASSTDKEIAKAADGFMRQFKAAGL